MTAEKMVIHFTKVKWMTINEIENLSKGFFFDKASMRFFNSRLPQGGHANSESVYFVTSEKFDHNSPRLYTIRRMGLESGRVDTVGEFQGYKTSATAWKYALKFCKEYFV